MHKLLTNKAKPKRISPMRADPTRTAGLRKAFERWLRKRFAEIANDIRKLVMVEDAFGLMPDAPKVLNAESYFASCPRDERGRCTTSDGASASSEGTAKEGFGEKVKKELLSKAAEIGFSDEVVRLEQEGVESNDYTGIEDRMSEADMREMQQSLEAQADEEARTAADDYEPEVSSYDVAQEAGYSRADISEWIDSDIIPEIDDDPDLTDQQKGEIREALHRYQISSRAYGEAGIEGAKDAMPDFAPGHVRQMFDERAETARSEMEEKQAEMEDADREHYVSQYEFNYAEARREYLREFHRNNPEMFQETSAEIDLNTWQKDNDGDDVLRFEAAGQHFDITAISRSEKGMPYTDVQFSDSSGSFGITGKGKGGAHEVFGSVMASMVAYTQAKNPTALTFSAAEPSRRKLYDRVVKTLSKVDDRYAAMSYDVPGGSRQYLVVKREYRDAYQSAIGSKLGEPNVIVNEADEEPDPAWFTPSGWVGNAGRWQFATRPDKVKAFRRWLMTQFNRRLTGKDEEKVWQEYAKAGLERGQGRAYDDVMKHRPELRKEGLDFARGSRAEFLQSAFRQPESVDKLKLIAGRAFDELEDVTADMSRKMTRVLVDGLAGGKHANDVADALVERVGIGEQRARVIARTEIIRAHAEGQLLALEQLGVEEVGVMVEWATAGDNAVCPRCRPLEGVVLKLDEARNKIPLHPNCRCAWIPANLGEGDDDEYGSKQKRSKAEIDEAFDEADIDDEVDAKRPTPVIQSRLLPALAEFSRTIRSANDTDA